MPKRKAKAEASIESIDRKAYAAARYACIGHIPPCYHSDGRTLRVGDEVVLRAKGDEPNGEKVHYLHQWQIDHLVGIGKLTSSQETRGSDERSDRVGPITA